MYECSDERFDFGKLIQAYGGESNIVNNVAEFNQCFDKCLSDKKGIKFIEIPVGLGEEDQSEEIKLLNLYIKSRSGDVESLEKWLELI